MKAIVYKTAQMFCFAKIFATAYLCLMVFTSPALAEAYATHEINGDFATDYFTAKIHLVEANHQLMLTKVSEDASSHQYASKPYPIEFKFEGHGWSADLATPIHMEITNSFAPDDNYSSVIRANVNFTTTEFGQTQSRAGIATLRLAKTDDWAEDETVSLNIMDASDANVTLYNSSHQFAMVEPDAAKASLTLSNGQFNIHGNSINNVNMGMYQAQVYGGQIYVQPTDKTADITNDPFDSYETPKVMARYTTPITQISMSGLPQAQPMNHSLNYAASYAPPLTQISTALPVAPAPFAPQQQTVIPAAAPPSFQAAPVSYPDFTPAPDTKTPSLSGGSFLMRH